METKKYPKVNVRVIKAQSHESDSVIAKADFSTGLQPKSQEMPAIGLSHLS